MIRMSVLLFLTEKGLFLALKYQVGQKGIF
jgi:hypothetical protein